RKPRVNSGKHLVHAGLRAYGRLVIAVGIHRGEINALANCLGAKQLRHRVAILSHRCLLSSDASASRAFSGCPTLPMTLRPTQVLTSVFRGLQPSLRSEIPT